MPKLGRRRDERTRELVRKLQEHESPAGLSFALSRRSVALQRGEGMYVTDVDGNIYLDFMSGFGATSTGHSHPRVVEAVREQAGKMVHAMAMTSPLRTELLAKIVAHTPGPAADKVVQFCTGGSEAVDVAIKQVRNFTGKAGIIAFEGAFHGRTTGTLALTSYALFRRGMGPLFGGVTHLPYAYCYRCAFGRQYPGCDLQCARYLESKLSSSSGAGDVGAVFVEPVQGVGGMVTPPPAFLAALRRICDRHGLLLVVDEVMSGWCRTGKTFACQHSDVVPDILIMAKGIASGYPLSAVVSRRDILAGWPPSTEGYTFAGNLVSCAAALATIRVMEEEDLAGNAARVGDYFAAGLQKLASRLPVIGEVRHRGLMVAVELVRDKETKEPLPAAPIVETLIDEGVLGYLGGYNRNVLAFLPPLILSTAHVDEALAIITDVLTAACT